MCIYKTFLNIGVVLVAGHVSGAQFALHDGVDGGVALHYLFQGGAVHQLALDFVLQSVSLLVVHLSNA